MAIIQRSIQLAVHASATISQKCRVAVLSKVNKAYPSLDKEDFPEAGKELSGKGFESRLKERTETAKAMSKISAFSPLSGTWRVMEQCATGHPPRSLANKEQTLPTKVKGFCTSPKPHYNQLVTTGITGKSFTNTFCPSTSWPPEVFSCKLESYYRRPSLGCWGLLWATK